MARLVGGNRGRAAQVGSPVDGRATEITRRRYNRVARVYDLEQFLLKRLAVKRWRDDLWSRVTPGAVLGVGVGTGSNFRHYPSRSRVVAVDLGEEMLRRAAARARREGVDVVRLMDHLGIERAHVVGYSLGGITVLKLAAAHPERLITACPLGAGWERPEESAFLAAVQEMADALESGRGIGPVAGRLGGQRDRPGILHTLWVLFLTRYMNDGKALADLMRAMPELAVSEGEISHIHLPMCSIVGSRDPLRPGAEALKERLPQVELTVVEGADHLRALTRKELHAALLSFLQRHHM